jgi:hypothetical protein
LGTEFFQQAGNEAVLLGSEGVEEVLDLNGLMALLGGLGLGRGNSLLGIFGELVQIHEEQLFKKNHPRARGIEADEKEVESQKERIKV